VVATEELAKSKGATQRHPSIDKADEQKDVRLVWSKEKKERADRINRTGRERGVLVMTKDSPYKPTMVTVQPEQSVASF